jgi:hypothetical protein
VRWHIEGIELKRKEEDGAVSDFLIGILFSIMGVN